LFARPIPSVTIVEVGMSCGRFLQGRYSPVLTPGERSTVMRSLREPSHPSVFRASIRISLFIAVCVGFVPAAALGAGVWLEGGDAGELVSTAQNTSGTGQLTTIEGSFQNDSDTDMYCIQVTDTAGFAAYITCTAFADHDLWLFDPTGFGVAHSDGCTAGVVKLTGQFVPSPGTYYLAVSISDAEATSSSGTIWDPPASGLERAPDGPGAPNALTSWLPAPSPPPDYSYTITLTGTGFCESAVPVEASSWGRVKSLYR